MSMNALRFDAQGLIPAIVQDEAGRVLMQAYMNRESLQITLDRRLCCFFSRSRQALWVKGETSGHFLHVLSVTADCDGDSLLIRARPDGPACHSGEMSCFHRPILEGEPPFSVDSLYALLEGRRRQPREGSYTSYLFEKGLDKILKKIGEESAEVIIAGKGGDRAETIYELADLCYHALVLMAQAGITPEDVRRELSRRQVVDHKTKQQKEKAPEKG